MALVGGIAHDVRTFATRLRLRIDAIPDENERARAAGDIDDMIRLLDDALLASRVGAKELNLELVDFGELVRMESADKGHDGLVALSVSCRPDELHLLGDKLALRRVVGNIIENAIKYGRCARITLVREASDIVMTVDDVGPGIPVEKRLLIFEPFTRFDPSRSRKTGGAGLGLAIARMFVETHGGAIEIADTQKGARLVVRLPAFTEGAPPPLSG